MEFRNKLLPILLKMREKGVRVDVDKAHQLKKEFQAQEKEYLLKIKQLAGTRSRHMGKHDK